MNLQIADSHRIVPLHKKSSEAPCFSRVVFDLQNSMIRIVDLPRCYCFESRAASPQRVVVKRAGPEKAYKTDTL